MAKKFYAVKKGITPGIYETWEACRLQIHGFSGAVYKGFDTEEEAQLFLNIDDKKAGSEDGETVAYVDGSYDINTKSFSYGIVLFHDGQELHFSKKCDDRDLAEMRNVAGEIKGSEAAIRYCLERNISEITIYHDYEGIAKWCTGEWRARKPGTMAYADFYREASAKICIKFRKVKGHSGNKYNELADRLAKDALGLK